MDSAARDRRAAEPDVVNGRAARCVEEALARGIGELIRAGNARCAALGLDAVIVLGHADYYPRFGFSAAAAESLEAPFSGPHFMALELRHGVLKAGGRVRYANAFGV